MAYVQNLFNTNFLEYASYVIKDRAIPHLDDGLKPVQRRILHSLFEMDDGKFHKVANVVGHCMKYHPHGDASIYSALVVLAQKNILIDTQGNFGNIFTGDEASAARYIECRALPLAKQILYNPEITQSEDSYDGRNREPAVFPAKVPLVLVLGAEGIAVGMSTKIMPHNFIEVMEAVKARLKGKKYALYPDFPTGGLMDVSGYEDGQGKVLVRAKLDTSDPKRIVIRELPFGSTTESLIASIENAARRNKVKIAGISDFTTENVEIEIKLARGVYSQEVVDALYAFTDCETSISVNLLVIKDRNPVAMTVSEVIEYHANRLVGILKAELELEQGKLRDKLHARTLERIFIEERVYKEIEQKKTEATVLKAVIDGLKPFAKEIRRPVTEEDVERLLKIPIRRISLYDINKAKKEIEEIEARIKQVAYHLAHLTEYAVGFLDTMISENKKHHPRKTKIVSFQKTDVREAAERNLKLRYDGESGYLGYGLSTGIVLMEVSDFDRVLVIRKSGAYSVTDVPEKLFVDREMLYCGFADKDLLAKKVFTVVYRDNETGYPYIKRCRIEQYILEKSYMIVPENATVLALTTEEDVALRVTYKAKSARVKVTEERFGVGEFQVKNARTLGVRLAAKEAESVTFERLRKSGKKQAAPKKKDAVQGEETEG